MRAAPKPRRRNEEDIEPTPEKIDSQGINSIPSSKHITNARTNPNNNDLLANKGAEANKPSQILEIVSRRRRGTRALRGRRRWGTRAPRGRRRRKMRAPQGRRNRSGVASKKPNKPKSQWKCGRLESPRRSRRV